MGLEREVEALRERNRSLKPCSQRASPLSHRFFEINQKVYRDVRQYLQEKEAVLAKQVGVGGCRRSGWRLRKAR